MKKTNLLSPDKNEIISVPSDMEEFYLLKGYHKLEKNYFAGEKLKKIYYKFSGKLRIIINLILKSNFILKNPGKKNLIIFDCESTYNLFQVVSEKNYFILSTRINKINNIYLSINILFYILINSFKRSMKVNYIIALVQNISPKLVLTNVANSTDFHIVSKALENTKIKFLAIQAADLTGSYYLKKGQRISKIFYLPEFFCFSSYEKKIFTDSECQIKKFNIVGSLMSSLANEYVMKNKVKIIPDKYDICLIAEPVIDLKEPFDEINNFDKTPGIIAEYVHRLCNKNNLKLIFVGKRQLGDPGIEAESNYYKNYLKNYNFKIFRYVRNNYGTHTNMMQSKLIIGNSSTTLREAFSYKKKVLSCINHPWYKYPSGGISHLISLRYEDFENRVMEILSLDIQKYEEKLSKKMEFTMLQTTSTADLVRNKISEYLR